MRASSKPKIVISYRRGAPNYDALTYRLQDTLANRYGAQAVFIDVDNIPYGSNFRDHIRRTIQASDVVLAIVGPDWAGYRDDGSVRIMDDQDPVRQEIEIAIESQVPIIPVLLDHSSMPKEKELPSSIQRFSVLNAAPIAAGRDFSITVTRLLAAIDQLLQNKGTAFPGLSIIRTSRLSQFLRYSPIITSIACVSIISLLLDRASLSPPWPTNIILVTSAVSVVIILLSYSFLRSSDTKRMRRVLIGSGLAAVLFSCCELTLVSLFTYEAGPRHERFVKGVICTPKAKLVYPDLCPFLGNEELRTGEYDAQRFWTEGSITAVRLALIASWQLFLVSFALLVTTSMIFIKDLGDD